MGRITKTFALLLTLIIAMSCLPLLTVKPVNAQSSEDVFIHKLTVINPDNSTTYNDTMPLNFTIDWSVNAPVSWMNLNFSYSIDGSIERHDLNGSLVNWGGFPVVTTTVTNGFVDVTNLTNGRHKLTISAAGNYDLDNDFVEPYNCSFNPIYFQVRHNTPNSTIAPQLITILVFCALIMVTLAISLLYRRHRKPTSLSK